MVNGFSHSDRNFQEHSTVGYIYFEFYQNRTFKGTSGGLGGVGGRFGCLTE